MSDLYHIPHDDGKTYRLKKFVEYQHFAPSVDCRFLGEWIKKYNIPKGKAVDMIWYHSVAYNEITAILLSELHGSPEEIWGKYKAKLNFGSGRAKAKNMDWFVPLMYGWYRTTHGIPFEWLLSLKGRSPEETYNNIINGLCKIKYVGHFAAYQFVDSVDYLSDWFPIDVKGSSVLDWNHCSNMTSGLYNILYEDEKANEFDRKHVVSPEDRERLGREVLRIQEEIRKTYPEQDSDISVFIGKVCSYRNLFKGARYGGFHHDRQLGVIREYEKSFPEFGSLWEKCYELRREIFPQNMLGELNGWDGIRNERKKLWLQQGLTGVEKGI